MKVYIVEYNGKVSSEGYLSEQKAIDFISGRCGVGLKKITGWYYLDGIGNEYKIKEISIKE